jgi:hypothetical protein
MQDSGPPLVDWAPPAPRRPLSRRQLAIRALIALVLVIVAAVIAANQLHVTALFSAGRTWEPTGRTEIHGDTWEGNVVTVGSTVYLLTREDITGFWGNLYLHRSDDGGASWADPVLVTSGDIDAARHSLTLASDGTLWAAWSQRGPQAESQRLLISHSRDGGLTWDAPTRVTSPDVRTVGIPALVMNADIRLVAFTDGSTGDVAVQPLDSRGQAAGDPDVIWGTSRRLYSDSTFLDAGLALARSGERAALAFDDGDRQHLAISSPGASEWIDQIAYLGGTDSAPRLVGTDDGFAGLFAVVSPSGGGGQLEFQVSTDGGESWGATAWLGRPVSGASLSRAEPAELGAWATCATARCRSVRIWLADMAGSFDEPSWIDAGSTTGPVAIEPTGTGIVLAWVEQGPRGAATDRTVVVTTGPRP